MLLKSKLALSIFMFLAYLQPLQATKCPDKSFYEEIYGIASFCHCDQDINGGYYEFPAGGPSGGDMRC